MNLQWGTDLLTFHSLPAWKATKNFWVSIYHHVHRSCLITCLMGYVIKFPERLHFVSLYRYVNICMVDTVQICIDLKDNV